MSLTSPQRRLLNETDARQRQRTRQFDPDASLDDYESYSTYSQNLRRRGIDPIQHFREVERARSEGLRQEISDFRVFNRNLAYEYHARLSNWQLLNNQQLSDRFEQFLDDLGIRARTVLMGKIRKNTQSIDWPGEGWDYDFKLYINSDETDPWTLRIARNMGGVAYKHMIRTMNQHSLPIKPFPSLEQMENMRWKRHRDVYGQNPVNSSFRSPRFDVGADEEHNFMNEFFFKWWPEIKEIFEIENDYN